MTAGRISAILFAAGLVACVQPRNAKPAQVEAAAGWIAVVWNGEAHVSFTDTLQIVHKVVAPDSVLDRAGGVVALNGRRVRIWGTLIPDGTLNVWKIVPDSIARFE